MPRGLWWLLEIPALAAFLAVPVLILTNYNSLPARIATHFGLSGKPDGYGDKGILWVMALAATIVYSLTSTAPFYPHLMNVPEPRTPKKIGVAIGMIRILKLETTVFIAALVWMMIETARGNAGGIGIVVPIGFAVCLLGTIGAGMILMNRDAS